MMYDLVDTQLLRTWRPVSETKSVKPIVSDMCVVAYCVVYVVERKVFVGGNVGSRENLCRAHQPLSGFLRVDPGGVGIYISEYDLQVMA